MSSKKPATAVRHILQRSHSEVHEDDVSEILSDFGPGDDDNEESYNNSKPVVYFTNKSKDNENLESTSREQTSGQNEFDIDEEFEEDEEEEEQEEEEEDEEDEGTSEFQ